MWRHLLQAPSVRTVLHRIVDGLATQVSQLLLLPKTADEDAIGEAVRAEVLTRGFSIATVDLRQLQAGISDVSFARLFLVSCGMRAECASLEDALNQPSLPEVVFVHGGSEQAPASQHAIIDLLTRWSRISQNAFERSRPCPTAFCAACVSDDVASAIHSEVHLNIEWWWGVPSALELALLCRELHGTCQTAEAIWREHLAPSLCGGDMNFLAEAWPDLLGHKSKLCAAIRGYGESLGWTRAEVEELRAASFHGDGDMPQTANTGHLCGPPSSVRSLWTRGMVQFTPEFGCELHCAASAMLGQAHALEQRMWRAQAALLLPRLDSLRHRLCEALADRYGPTWPLRWEVPQSADEHEELGRTHFACQWGYLEHLLRSCSAFRQERAMLPLVAKCRAIRNALAHFRSIEFEEFREIWNPSSGSLTSKVWGAV